MEKNEKRPPIIAPMRTHSYLPIYPAPEKVDSVENRGYTLPSTPTPFSSCSSSPASSPGFLDITPVPYSKWINIQQFCQGMPDDTIPKAKLVYYSKMSIYSGFCALDRCSFPKQQSIISSIQCSPLDKSEKTSSPVCSSYVQENSHFVEL